MPDQATIDSVGKKLQAWAADLPQEEQAVLAEWMSRASGDDVQGHWWGGEDAWANAWNSSWTESSWTS